jgi:hypothetical protein
VGIRIEFQIKILILNVKFGVVDNAFHSRVCIVELNYNPRYNFFVLVLDFGLRF